MTSNEQAETQDTDKSVTPWIPQGVQDWLLSDEPPPVNAVEVGPGAVAPSCVTCGRLVRDKYIPAMQCGGPVKCESHSEWIPKRSTETD